VIEAAGGVLWRPGTSGNDVEIALVHRPKYDDWSVPKGKLGPGELVLAAALREVEEETGMRGLPGPALGSIGYLKDREPKRVRYWSMRLSDGQFAPTDEVDRLMWLPPREALAHLHPDRDGPVVRRFAEQPHDTRPVLLVRHGSAGDQETWQGEDHDRPLDEQGRRQAEALVPLLAAYDVDLAHSADVSRCLETIGPYTSQRRIPVTSEPLLSETGVRGNADAALERLLTIAGQHRPVVVCTQRPVLDALLEPLLRALGERRPPSRSVRKGGFLAAHLCLGASRDQLVSVDEFEPPA
jgi:8-oxo-dGTP pyrophosphatase MutT (NUDIX family)/phosphohistidine phosphatase SixA